ncbi:tetratricopeptide repeat protein [Treponema phagedenis]|uniref:tetratricopeptide repeat protein n=1 Tax=Treponema phagedenis TaxID=162 RepID=UPI0011E62A48|nr:tetratricopeptide repeat protein [Treponema phagedenis]NVP25180.1 tetratricopeptide repeat protein [Treponema phagedenis]QEK05280.1 hypothetical protein FUT80_00085 [Treponema phagedenis]QKS93154.1 tetratricopeptide repeat protein [Treponema phagedenis]QLC59135.1 tetratricopeptide repeat protein [Treponema phagedenis]QSH94662.1 hypothetical protein C5O78_06345 [Treponema phagedenis]
MKRNSRLKVVFFFFSIFSCQSSKDAPVPIEQAVVVPKNAKETILKTPDKEEFMEERANLNILRNIQIGSPYSFRKAVKQIQEDSLGLTINNRLYLQLITRFMRYLYPFEPISWNTPLYTEENVFLTALNKIESGEYPYELSENDFLSLIIPPLLLTVKNITISKTHLTDILHRIQAAQKLMPESVLPAFLLGKYFELQGSSSKAETAYRLAWEIAPSCYPAGIQYARFAAAGGNTEQAKRIGNQLLQRFPDNIEIFLLQAEIYLKLKDLDSAEPYIIEVLKRRPENTAALLLRIQILIERKEYLKANALLDAYATKNRTDKEYLLFRARVAKEWIKNFASAKAYIEQAYQYYPENISVLLACAEICFDTGETITGMDANDFITTILKKDSENMFALKLLIKNDIALEKWQQAIPRAEHLNAKYPGDENRELLIQVYIGAGNTEKAVNLARQLYNASENPSDALISLYLETLYASKNFQQIRFIINGKLDSARSPLKSILLYYQAMLSTSEDSKLGLLRSSLLADPRNKPSLFAMYTWYYRRQDYRKAQYYLRQLIALDPSNHYYADLAKKLETIIE